MAQINLLPWRDERRAELKKQFISILVLMLIVGVASVYLVDTTVQSKIARQQERIKFIQDETSSLDKIIEEIKELKHKRESLVARMEVIQNLQGNRSIVVHHFDELVRTLPKGVYFTRINKKDKKFNIQGVAEANNRVSNLMRNLDESVWFSNPVLSEIKATDESVEASSSLFVLSVQESEINNKEEE